MTPYGYWRRTHAVHHATTGNLDRRGMGDVSLLTVAEYRALPRGRRISYRLSRNPVVLLVVAPFYLFVLKYRVPRRKEREKHDAPLQDAQRAMSLVRSKAAQWKIDPDRIGMVGFSAGAMLTVATALVGQDAKPAFIGSSTVRWLP